MQRLTKLLKLPQPEQHGRRPSEPPELWLAVAAGSVAIHVVLALLLPMRAQLSVAERSPIPIDLVEVNPGSLDPSIAAASPQTTVSPPPSPQSAEAVLPPPPPAITPIPSTIPDVIAEPEPQPAAITPQPSPTPTPSPAPTEASSPSPSSTPSPQPSPTPTSEITENGPEPVEPSPISTRPPAPFPEGSGDDGPSTAGDDQTLPSVTVDSSVSPVGLMAIVQGVNFRPDHELRDIPDQLASPQQTNPDISELLDSTCPLVPEAAQYLGTTVGVNVTVEADGKVSYVEVREDASSQNLAYDDWIVCLVTHWEFNPALTDGQPVASDSQILSVTIDRNQPM